MLNNLFEKYFWSGIKNDSAYNWLDTTVYALIFVGAIWFLYDKFFKAKKIKINRQFIVALTGWIIFGSSLRASEDAGIYQTVLLVTPFFYVTAFAVSFSLLLVAMHFGRKCPYLKSWGAAGYLLGAFLIMNLPLKNLYGMLNVLFVWLLWCGLFFGILIKFPKYLSRWNFATLSAQMLDASSTFVALTFYSNFWEKHVLGSTLMSFFEARNILLISGSVSWIMFALKLAVVPVVLYAIDKYGETDGEKNFLKMIILMLGLAVGLRNTLEIGMFAE